MALELGYVIPNPITVDEYLRFGFEGSFIQRDGIYIDEIEDVIKYIFKGVPIKGMTLTIQDCIYECREGQS
jgi:hypothetical protein